MSDLTFSPAAVVTRATGSTGKKAARWSAAQLQALALWLIRPDGNGGHAVIDDEGQGSVMPIPRCLIADTSRNGITDQVKACVRQYGIAFPGSVAPSGQGAPVFAWLSNYTPDVRKHPEADPTVVLGVRLFVPDKATSAKVREGFTLSPLPADGDAWLALAREAPESVQALLAQAQVEAAHLDENGQPAPQYARTVA